MEPEPRGAHILGAAVEVVAGDGLSSLSMRSVATAAGTSLAQVQYYFRTKDELIGAAFDYVCERFLASLHGLATTASGWQSLRDAVWLWLPLDAEREKVARVWLAFSAAAATNSRLAATAAQLDDQLRAWFTQDLDALQQAGELSAHTDTSSVAATLLALVDGLTTQSLILSVERRHELVTTVMEHFFHGLLPIRRPSASGEK